jgi:crossover junction endodeoxyribonuclease RuvC
MTTSAITAPHNRVPRILAIDPGYDRVGWAIGQAEGAKPQLEFCGLITTDKKAVLFDRYKEIDTELSAVISQYQPTELSIESLFFFKNAKTALKVSEARGVILSAALRQGVQVTEYTPLQVKQAVTGYGRASKEELDKMVKLQLKIETAQLIDDTVDAIGLYITHFYSRSKT